MIWSTAAFVCCALALIVVLHVGVRRDAMVTSARMFERALANPTIRVAIIVVWWWVGWHFLVGQTVDPSGV